MGNNRYSYFEKRIVLLCSIIAVMLVFSPALHAGGEAEEEAEVRVDAVGESPMLAERVERGELPPLEERLPLEPMVVEPVDGIGQYGGTWYGGHIGATHWANEFSGIVGRANLLYFDMEDASLIPQVAQDWEVLDDGREVMVYLREGLRWSDGHPMTSEDIMFWYEDILLNSELTPSIPSWLMVKGEVVEVEAVDEYTVRFSFNGEYHPHFPTFFALHGIDLTRAPKHFFQDYHPRYADANELQRKTEEAGYDEWWQLFNDLFAVTHQNRPDRNPDIPSLHAYIGVEYEPGLTRLERNPYFYKVDPEGNQLPYIDRARVEHVGDGEVLEAMAVAGDLDYYRGFAPSLSLYQSATQTENLQIAMWQDPQGGRVAVSPNRTHEDPVMRDLFNEPAFIQALSLAIDREEMNDLIYLGLGEPRQFSLLPPSPYYREEYSQAYADFDPDEAVRLITEEVGLEFDNGGRLLRPDGEQVSIEIEVIAQVDWERGGELIADYWREHLGIDARSRLRAQEFHIELHEANEMDVRLWGERVPPPSIYYNLGGNFVPGTTTFMGPLWGDWVASGGSSGVEPPDIVQSILEWHEDWYHHADEDVRDEALHKIMEAQAEHLWRIGTVGNVPQPLVLSGDLRNVPEGVWYAHDFNFVGMGRPETWYFGTEERRRD